jgi:hypothetical protein
VFEYDGETAYFKATGRATVQPSPTAGTQARTGDTKLQDAQFHDLVKTSTKHHGKPGTGKPSPQPETTLGKIVDSIRQALDLFD